MLEIIKRGSTAAGLRLRGQDFLADSESREVIIPRSFLSGFLLSEIPDNLVIKPVEAIESGVIHINKDISIGKFCDGSSAAQVEDTGRRKLWDGDVGFGKFMEAMRQSVNERHETVGDVAESDFQDDGDYILLFYGIRISEDIPFDVALLRVESVIAELEARRAQILSRRLDPLLGIFDRGTLDSDLTYGVGVAIASHSFLALILLDLDHFKMINDSYGHPIGDAILKTVAQILADKVSSKGEAYRYGGEELAALLVGMTAQEAVGLGEEIRQTIAKHDFERKVKVTVSCGVACFPGDAANASGLLEAADTALYAAKRAGRNVVKAAGESSPPRNTETPLQLEAVLEALHDPRTTALQKSQFTQRHQGQFVTWTGRAQSVQRMWEHDPNSDILAVISSATADRHGPTDLATAVFPNSETSVLAQLGAGDVVVIEGTLDFHELGGDWSASLRNSRLVRVTAPSSGHASQDL